MRDGPSPEGGSALAELARANRRLRDAQEELRRAGKLAAVGELAASVAHEINNPLTSILGFAELLREDPDPDELDGHLERIVVAARRAKGVVQDLLTLAREATVAHRPTDLKKVVYRVLESYSERFVELEIDGFRDVDSDLPMYEADARGLEEMVSHLVDNAVRAVSEGPERCLGVRVARREPGVWITVEDTGPGIAPRDGHRIFEPFFTTRDVGDGQGIGLPLAYSAARAHGGTLRLDRTGPSGSSFVAELALRPSPEPALPHLRGARILVIDRDRRTVEATRGRCGPDATILSAERWESGLDRLAAGGVARVVVGIDDAPPVPRLLDALERGAENPIDRVQLVGSRLLDRDTRALLDVRDVPHAYQPLSPRDLFP